MSRQAGKARVGGLDGAARFRGAALGDGADALAGGGIDDSLRGAVGGVDPRAVDVALRAQKRGIGQRGRGALEVVGSHGEPFESEERRAQHSSAARATLASFQAQRTMPRPGRDEDHRAEGDAIPRERHEIVSCHVADEPAHAQQRRDEGGHEPDGEEQRIGVGEQRAILPRRIGARGDQRGHGEEERKFRRGLAREAEEHAADDRGARPRRPGDEREGLRDAHLERIERAHVVHFRHARHRGTRALPALHPQDHERARDEGERDGNGVEERCLDRLAEQQPEHRRGQERDRDVDDEALRCALVRARRRGHAAKRARYSHTIASIAPDWIAISKTLASSPT